MAAKIEEVLPVELRGHGLRLANRALMTFQRRPEIAECSKDQFRRIVIEAAEHGLAIDGRLAHVVKFKGQWQLLIDYKGLIAIARRTGQITDVVADVVCENDEWEAFRQDDACHLYHQRAKTNRGAVVGAYAVLKMPGGGWRYEYMDREELDAIQRRAPSQKGPWSTDPNEMRKKTVIRRALKTCCGADLALSAAAALLDDSEDDERVAAGPATQAIGPPVGRMPLRHAAIPAPVLAEEQEHELAGEVVNGADDRETGEALAYRLAMAIEAATTPAELEEIASQIARNERALGEVDHKAVLAAWRGRAETLRLT